MKNRIISIALVAAMAITMTACGGSSSQPAEEPAKEAAAEETAAPEEAAADEAAPAAAEGGVTTVEEGTLIMATNAYFPPYEFYEGSDIVGIDADIAKAVADKLGLQLRIEDMEFDSIITAVQSGRADMGLAGMTVTEERLQSINFTESYAQGIQVIVVTEDSPIASVDDLTGKKIGVQLATTGDIYCKDDFGEENVEEYNKAADAIMALKSGRVDCVVVDNEPAKSFVASTDGLKILDTEYVTEDYAACISKDNQALLDAVNGALAELKADGTLDSIISTYITAE